MKNKLKLLICIYVTLSLLISFASAHRSGCHRWHSCPSDSGSYICGDTGYCSGCPDNEYCKNGQPRIINQPTTSDEGGSSGCNYDWQCTLWSECSSNGKQTRTCTNKGTCTDKLGKPPEVKDCVYIIPPIEEHSPTPPTQTSPAPSPIPISPTPPQPEPKIECKGTFQGVVEKIIDGDTLVIKGCKNSIRLSLVDTPEYNKEGYAEAKSFVERLCNVTSIATIDQDEKQLYDKYKRIVALVYCQNKKLNAELIYNRLGVIDTRFCSTSEFVNEDWAKNYGCETKQSIQPKEFPSTGQIIKTEESKKEPKSVIQVIINFLKSIFQ